MQKWMLPMERARKTVKENGMICYVCKCSSWDNKVWISGKSADSAVLAIFKR